MKEVEVNECDVPSESEVAEKVGHSWLFKTHVYLEPAALHQPVVLECLPYFCK